MPLKKSSWVRLFIFEPQLPSQRKKGLTGSSLPRIARQDLQGLWLTRGVGQVPWGERGCVRTAAKSSQQLIPHLPAVRVTAAVRAVWLSRPSGGQALCQFTDPHAGPVFLQGKALGREWPWENS